MVLYIEPFCVIDEIMMKLRPFRFFKMAVHAHAVQNESEYDYDGWSSDFYSWWRELRARMPDNISVLDYEYMGDFKAPGSHQDGLKFREFSDQELTALRAVNILRVYFNPGVASVVLLLFLLTVPVLSKITRQTSSSHLPYLMALCVCSLLHMIGVTLTWLGFIGVNVYKIPGTCQFNAFVSQASHFLYTWVMVALVTDRLAAQLISLKTCPSWLTMIVSPTRARILILILSTIALAVFLNLSMMEGTVHFGTVKICVVIIEYLKTSLLLDKIDSILNFFCPFFAMVVMDIALILNHCRLKLRRVPFDRPGATPFPVSLLRPSPSPSGDTPPPEEPPPATTISGRSPSASSIITTVVISATYIICSLPNVIQRTVSTFADDHLLFSMTARGVLYQHSFSSIFYSAFATNMVLIIILESDVRLAQLIAIKAIYACMVKPCNMNKPDLDSESGGTACTESNPKAEFFTRPLEHLEVQTDV